jgi:hypothetical protein
MKRLILILAMFLFALVPSFATDHGWDPNNPVSQWFNTLKRPDYPQGNCCGKGDAYKIQIIEEAIPGSNGRAVITDGEAIEFPDGTKRAPVANGTEFTYPYEKQTKPSQSNPTKTAWVFMYVNNVGKITTLFCVVPLPPSY